MGNGNGEPGRRSDLDTLRERHGKDGWFFTSIWAAAGSGPDVRVLAAQRRGVTLSDLTADALSDKIRREDERGSSGPGVA